MPISSIIEANDKFLSRYADPMIINLFEYNTLGRATALVVFFSVLPGEFWDSTLKGRSPISKPLLTYKYTAFIIT
jgi:hypothetical protein